MFGINNQQPLAINLNFHQDDEYAIFFINMSVYGQTFYTARAPLWHIFKKFAILEQQLLVVLSTTVFLARDGGRAFASRAISEARIPP